MHNPIALSSIRSSPFVKNQGLPHSDDLPLRQHRLIPSGSLPESGCRRPIRPRPRRILPILVAEEIPLVLLFISQFAPICNLYVHIHILINQQLNNFFKKNRKFVDVP